MSQTKGYVDADYLQITAQMIQKVKVCSYNYMKIELGQKLLDIGCGAGIDTKNLANLVGPNGQVEGVDYDPEMVAKAKQLVEQSGMSTYVVHRLASANSLPFQTDEFDATRSERLFQHLYNPAQALSEMIRVTKKGGWVVVLDTDWGSASVETPEFDIERRLMRIQSERCLYNGYSGRQLYGLFKRANLADITIEIFPQIVTNYLLFQQIIRLDHIQKEALMAGLITNDELQKLHQSLERADRDGIFFSSCNMVLLAGRKF